MGKTYRNQPTEKKQKNTNKGTKKRNKKTNDKNCN